MALKEFKPEAIVETDSVRLSERTKTYLLCQWPGIKTASYHNLRTCSMPSMARHPISLPPFKCLLIWPLGLMNIWTLLSDRTKTGIVDLM